MKPCSSSADLQVGTQTVVTCLPHQRSLAQPSDLFLEMDRRSLTFFFSEALSLQPQADLPTKHNRGAFRQHTRAESRVLVYMLGIARGRGLSRWQPLVTNFHRLRHLATMAAPQETRQPVASPAGDAAAAAATTPSAKLHGRAFYESIGSPKFVVAPMVNQSEFVSTQTEPDTVTSND